MSKFKFTPDEDGDFGIEYSPTDDNFSGWLRHISGEDLAYLATAAQAALVEQKSGVRAETRTCRCNLRTYGVDRYPVCKAEFKQDEDEDAAADFCDNTIRMLGDAPVPCGHCKSCHS